MRKLKTIIRKILRWIARNIFYGNKKKYVSPMSYSYGTVVYEVSKLGNKRVNLIKVIEKTAKRVIKYKYGTLEISKKPLKGKLKVFKNSHLLDFKGKNSDTATVLFKDIEDNIYIIKIIFLKNKD